MEEQIYLYVLIFGPYAYVGSTINPNARLYTHNSELITAFKQNAWMQVRHLTADEAKEKYIEIINQLLKDRQ
jgi:acyl-CoA-binding protein